MWVRTPVPGVRMWRSRRFAAACKRTACIANFLLDVAMARRRRLGALCLRVVEVAVACVCFCDALQLVSHTTSDDGGVSTIEVIVSNVSRASSPLQLRTTSGVVVNLRVSSTSTLRLPIADPRQVYQLHRSDGCLALASCASASVCCNGKAVCDQPISRCTSYRVRGVAQVFTSIHVTGSVNGCPLAGAGNCTVTHQVLGSGATGVSTAVPPAVVVCSNGTTWASAAVFSEHGRPGVAWCQPAAPPGTARVELGHWMQLDVVDDAWEVDSADGAVVNFIEARVMARITITVHRSL